VYITILCGALGYLFHKLACEPAPLILGFILGPMMEENLRRALLLSRGSAMTFIERPISLTLLVMSAILLVLVLLPSIKKTREVAFQED
jgi:TctA family transporter